MAASQPPGGGNGPQGAKQSPSDQYTSGQPGWGGVVVPEAPKTSEEVRGFTGDIEVRLTPYLDGHRAIWALLVRVTYGVGFKDSLDQIVLEVGTWTDGASIPFPISIVLPVVNFKTFLPCALHDELVRRYRREKQRQLPVTRSRKEIDRIFHEALRVKKVGRVMARLLWLGVRVNAIARGEK